LPNGALKLIDRKKNIYKLQQGEYIAPEKVESIYARNKFVAETFLYGDSNREYNIAIIHPNLDALQALATNLGVQESDVKKLC
jgi:long-chain acyl-CoA synthetase